MAEFHFALKWSHVVFGVCTLIAFWISAFAMKGSHRHIRAGRVFSWFAYASLATAFISFTWCLTATSSFLGDANASPDTMANARFFMAILGYGGTSLYASIRFGITLVQCRDCPERIKRLAHVYPQWLMLAASVGLIVYGFAYFGPGTARRYVLPIVAGLSGVWLTYRNLRFVFASHENDNWWTARHIESMILSGMTSHVAPAVVIAIRSTRVGWLSPTNTPIVLALAALVPCIIGFVVLLRTLRKYREQNGYVDRKLKRAAMST